jgi:gamma-glutamyltranspeptidase
VSLEGRLSRDTIQRMIALGHHVQVGGEWSNTSAPVVIQKKDGVLNGAADPRRGRFVFGK